LIAVFGSAAIWFALFIFISRKTEKMDLPIGSGRILGLPPAIAAAVFAMAVLSRW
jgi:hypothetical protein